jgi:hypothetical protein
MSDQAAAVAAAADREEPEKEEPEEQAHGQALVRSCMESASAFDYAISRVCSRTQRAMVDVVLAVPDALTTPVSTALGAKEGSLRELFAKGVSCVGFVRTKLDVLTPDSLRRIKDMEQYAWDEWNRTRDLHPDRETRTKRPSAIPSAAANAAKACLKRPSSPGRSEKRIRIEIPIVCQPHDKLAWMLSKHPKDIEDDGADQFSQFSPLSVIERLRVVLSCPMQFSVLVDHVPAAMMEFLAEVAAVATMQYTIDMTKSVCIRLMMICAHAMCRSEAPYPLNTKSWHSWILSDRPECRATWALIEFTYRRRSPRERKEALGIMIFVEFLSCAKGVSLFLSMFEHSTGIRIGDRLPATCAEHTIMAWISAVCHISRDFMRRKRFQLSKKDLDACRDQAQAISDFDSRCIPLCFASTKNARPKPDDEDDADKEDATSLFSLGR